MATRRQWTKEEDKVLVQAIEANPHNLAQSFRQVGEQLDRSFKSVQQRWYQTLANPNNKKYVGTAFLVISKKGYNGIRKNSFTTVGYSTTVKTPKKLGIWSKVKKLLGL